MFSNNLLKYLLKFHYDLRNVIANKNAAKLCTSGFIMKLFEKKCKNPTEIDKETFCYLYIHGVVFPVIFYPNSFQIFPEFPASDRRRREEK
jgi:hypothetical protein